MYEAAALAVGASLTGVDALVDGTIDLAFNAGGGYHHAASDYASGFCIFNDAVIAIQKLLQKGVERVAYIDIDAHHGDGVQNAFYQTNKVMTISIHQSGDTLFPGTGSTDEVGEEAGIGYSVNLPMPPNTNDDTYFDAFMNVVPKILEVYDPEILVAQLGIDTHFNDPLSQISLTSQGHNRIVKQIINLAPGKLLALGGGGYDLSAVTRSWALDYAAMAGLELPNDIPEKYFLEYGIRKLEDDTIIGPNTNSVKTTVQKNIDTIKGNISKYLSQ
jgi:acetoin utilization protein AcuC